ncbi:ATP-binding cassette domain-containing protein [Paenibacillus polymyxa]|nr:ATP-binding cassette domain-containing protein [Paenibacillus polymyxa]WCM62682.1 ATP-binding cassette domain-containing protein [Paenibacillus polymyxa]
MISIQNLSKSFGDKLIFSNLNLEIDSGDFVIFSGPSGCGKTTLLNMIGAIENIKEGNIIIDGLDIKNKKKSFAIFPNKSRIFISKLRFGRQ